MNMNPLKGMKDYLPKEMQLRDYVQGKILDTYRSHGFERIATPILEDAENLDKSEGGDNLNLIFKVLKRGDKLEAALSAGDEAALSDMGLRYDLTLPLSRFFAANRVKLPTPFKVIQTDRVFRAERPQKGRMREFVQCDIDILGDNGINAEIELIYVTAKALLSIGFSDFTVNINDRRMLRGMLEAMGFAPETLESVCVTFDKMDKIGAEGVEKELQEKAFPKEAIAALTAFLSAGDFSLEKVTGYLQDKAIAEDMQAIIGSVKKLTDGQWDIAYTPSLVRGQGYYTGVVFEVTCAAFRGAVAGGGRYDGLIGKFLGEDIPAVGFSIGFERICAILLESAFAVPASSKMALLYREDVPFADVLRKANRLSETYAVTALRQAKKLGKQLGVLEAEGYEAVAFFDNEEIKLLGQRDAF
jgi:histidyl-tRNA synthetase